MKTLRKTTTLPQRGDGDPRARINSEFDPPPTAITLSSPMATPGVEQELEVDMATSENLPWVCIVWDDPVNLMSYVTYVFQTVLGYDKKTRHGTHDASSYRRQSRGFLRGKRQGRSRREKAPHPWVVGNYATGWLSMQAWKRKKEPLRPGQIPMRLRTHRTGNPR